jgi:predicted RNA-binding Zn ribbon-like protein
VETKRAIATTPLEGGHLALDFVNTTGGMRDEPPKPDDEMLETYEDLVAWSLRLGLLSDRDARGLRRAAASDPAKADAQLERALGLRDLVYAVFRPIAEGDAPPAELLDRLRDADREALAQARLSPAGKSMRWSWPSPKDLAAPLWPVAHAAVELLTDGPLDRVKVCSNCRWLFLDRSRNRSRRWCSMEECGTQIKQRRFVERRRETRARAR